MNPSHDIVVGFTFAVLVATYMYAALVSGQENYCPADRFFPNNMTYPYPVDDLIYAEDGIIVCTKELCHLTTYSTLDRYYGSLFIDPSEVAPDNVGTPDVDGDRCCPSEIRTKIYKGKMEDSLGQMCNVMVLRATNGRNNYTRYQHVTEGRCKPNSTCALTGSDCQQMYIPQPLLARKKGDSIRKMAFYQFNVPSYCSCVN